MNIHREVEDEDDFRCEFYLTRVGGVYVMMCACGNTQKV